MAKRIMIIDDYESDRLLYKEYLDNQGYEFLEASDGDEAAHLLTRHVPDVILLDWQMPKKNGLELLTEIDEQFDIKGTPVIMITGMLQDQVRQQAYDHGSIDFISKPVDQLDLQVRVKRAVDSSEAYMGLKSQIGQVNELNKRVEIQKSEIAKLQQIVGNAQGSLSEAAQLASMQLIAYESDHQSIQTQLREIQTITDSMVSQASTDNPLKAKATELHTRLSDLSGQEIGWKGVQVFAQSAFPGLLPKLQLKYPDLTVQDIKHCIYIKMGLDTKTVSEMLGVSEKTVRVIRDRIRSKFDLELDDSLSMYLQQL